MGAVQHGHQFVPGQEAAELHASARPSLATSRRRRSSSGPRPMISMRASGISSLDEREGA